jgi:hypothetical protein
MTATSIYTLILSIVFIGKQVGKRIKINNAIGQVEKVNNG